MARLIFKALPFAAVTNGFEVATFGFGQLDTVYFCRHLSECTKASEKYKFKNMFVSHNKFYELLAGS